MPLNTVLCPVSLLPSSVARLRYAASLARIHHARLRIFHVLDPVGRPPTGTNGLTEARELVEARYIESVPLEGRTAIEREVAVAEGDMAEQVAAASEDQRVDLIVMGFQQVEQQWAVHALDKVLRRVRKPVLALPTSAQAATPDWRRILLATDLAAESATTQAAAVAMAELSGATLMVLHVVEELPAATTPEAFSQPPYRDIALEEAARRLDSAFDTMPCRPAEMVVCGGDLSGEIVRVAEREAADLLVVGFRSAGHHLTGTLASRLLNRIGCPVMAVPHTAAGRLASAA